MQAKLLVTGGKANKKEVSFNVPLVVGRSRGAGLTIAHPMISRQHCEIFEAGGLLRIRDLGSTNGTYVSGKKIEEAVLRPHEQFSIGPLTFEVNYEYAGDATLAEEKHEGYAGALRATTVSAEASGGDSEPGVAEEAFAPLEAQAAEDAAFDFLADAPAAAEPALPADAPPDLAAEAAMPPEGFPGGVAEPVEQFAPAEAENEGFGFLPPTAEPAEASATPEAASEGFEFLEPPAESFGQTPSPPLDESPVPLPVESPVESPEQDFQFLEPGEDLPPIEEPAMVENAQPAGSEAIGESSGFSPEPQVVSDHAAEPQPPMEFMGVAPAEPAPGVVGAETEAAGQPDVPTPAWEDLPSPAEAAWDAPNDVPRFDAESIAPQEMAAEPVEPAPVIAEVETEAAGQPDVPAPAWEDVSSPAEAAWDAPDDVPPFDVESIAPPQEAEPAPPPPIEASQPLPASLSPSVAPAEGDMPDFSAWSDAPAADVASQIAPEPDAAPQFESFQEYETPAESPVAEAEPSASDAGFFSAEETAWGAVADQTEAESPQPIVADSQANPSDDSPSDAPTTAFAPAASPRQAKSKKGWWPFKKDKAVKKSPRAPIQEFTSPDMEAFGSTPPDATHPSFREEIAVEPDAATPSPAPGETSSPAGPRDGSQSELDDFLSGLQ